MYNVFLMYLSKLQSSFLYGSGFRYRTVLSWSFLGRFHGSVFGLFSVRSFGCWSLSPSLDRSLVYLCMGSCGRLLYRVAAIATRYDVD